MEQKILESITKPLEIEGIKVSSVKYGEEDGEKTLFVVIKSDSVVDTNLCVKATEIISPIIDELNLINEEYVLDVCSEGVQE